MGNPFFDHPILNSPYQEPSQYWELDEEGQPTQQVIQTRRTAQFITPIPKPRRRRANATQQDLPLDEGQGLSTENQQYATTSTINELRMQVDLWRKRPDPTTPSNFVTCWSFPRGAAPCSRAAATR